MAIFNSKLLVHQRVSHGLPSLTFWTALTSRDDQLELPAVGRGLVEGDSLSLGWEKVLIPGQIRSREMREFDQSQMNGWMPNKNQPI